MFFSLNTPKSHQGKGEVTTTVEMGPAVFNLFTVLTMLSRYMGGEIATVLVICAKIALHQSTLLVIGIPGHFKPMT